MMQSIIRNSKGKYWSGLGWVRNIEDAQTYRITIVHEIIGRLGNGIYEVVNIYINRHLK